jgi:hypothetical protein
MASMSPVGCGGVYPAFVPRPHVDVFLIDVEDLEAVSGISVGGRLRRCGTSLSAGGDRTWL